MARPTIKTANILRVELMVMTTFAISTVKAEQETAKPSQDYRTGVLSAELA